MGIFDFFKNLFKSEQPNPENEEIQKEINPTEGETAEERKEEVVESTVTEETETATDEKKQ